MRTPRITLTLRKFASLPTNIHLHSNPPFLTPFVCGSRIAQWCPPCRGFTPVLAKNYTDNYSAKGMEIVFVSSDRDEASFKSYPGT